MCYKGIVGFIGTARSEVKEEKKSGCNLREDLAGLSFEEVVTKYGTIRLDRHPTFKSMFKKLWENF